MFTLYNPAVGFILPLQMNTPSSVIAGARTLSPLATKLLDYLVKTGGASEGKCAEHLFNKPEYVKNGDNSAYWQWDCDLHGGEMERDGVKFSGPLNYIDTYTYRMCAAAGELVKAGLVDEINNGYACYYFKPTDLCKVLHGRACPSCGRFNGHSPYCRAGEERSRVYHNLVASTPQL